MTKTILELNGRQYDVSTGKALDGVLPTKPATVKPDVSAVVQPPVRHAAAHVKHHRVEHSKTLMRQAVEKPKHVPVTALPSVTEHVHHDKRHARATTTAKSHLVTKFSTAHTPAITTQTLHLPVQPAPKDIEPPVSFKHHQPSSPQSRLEARALAAANNFRPIEPPKTHHTHQRVARKLGVSPRFVGLGAGLAATVLLIGFFAYQNVPNLAMRLAANRAGFAATLPSYQPSGFSMKGPIQYGPGQISLTFQANADSRRFQLTQQTSKWNNDTLLDQFVAVNNRQYQTYQAGNKTIYIYDQSNATWLNKGVWYRIAGNSKLNSDQLIHLANSL